MGWFDPKKLESKDGLIETICAITWYFEGGKTYEVDELRESLTHLNDAELKAELAQLLDVASMENDVLAEGISEMFPSGYINHHNSDYEQWGGTVPEYDGPDYGAWEDHLRGDR